MGTHPIFESDFDCLTEWECSLDSLDQFLTFLSEQLFSQHQNPHSLDQTSSILRLTCIQAILHTLVRVHVLFQRHGTGMKRFFTTLFQNHLSIGLPQNSVRLYLLSFDCWYA